jgi:crotonobetaine/carnitine-CoA ligase
LWSQREGCIVVVVNRGQSALPAGLPHRPVDQRTIPRLLDDGASSWPKRTALCDHERSITYAQLRELADRHGAAIAALGVGWQQTCLFMLDNHLDHVVTWLGANYHGRVQAQVNTAYRGGLLTHVITNSGAATMIIEDRYCARLADVADSVPSLRTVVVRGGDGSALPPGRFEVLGFDDFLARGTAGSAVEVVRPWHRSAIIYTSGTTGPSKGVVHPHALAFSYVSPQHWNLVERDDVVLVTLPQFHIGGQWTGILSPLMVGATAAVVERFSASTFWKQVEHFGVTQATLLAAMVTFLHAAPSQPDDADTTLAKVLMAPIIREADAFSERFGVQLAGGLGQTESSAPIAAPYGTTAPGACGWVRADFEIRVVDENDLDVEPGEPGEMIVRPREPWSVMLEYNNAPEATVAKWRNLWLHTGDLIRQDETGQVFFVDRTADRIRRRGENISSAEVEAELHRIAGVSVAAAIAVPSEDYEDEVKACVVLEAGSDLDEAALYDQLKRRLPYFMVPRFVEFYDDLPRTPTERVQKSELRAQGVTARTWDSRAHGVEARYSDV